MKKKKRAEKQELEGGGAQENGRVRNNPQILVSTLALTSANRVREVSNHCLYQVVVLFRCWQTSYARGGRKAVDSFVPSSCPFRSLRVCEGSSKT
jgi:hypothetical protein